MCTEGTNTRTPYGNKTKGLRVDSGPESSLPSSLYDILTRGSRFETTARPGRPRRERPQYSEGPSGPPGLALLASCLRESLVSPGSKQSFARGQLHVSTQR